MSRIVQFDSTGVVPCMVTKYIPSANTPDYKDATNTLINPDVSGLLSIPERYWKVDGTNVYEMDSTQQQTIDDMYAAKTIKAKNYLVAHYLGNGNVCKETWYYEDKGGGEYDVKVEETTYSYESVNVLDSKTTITYYFDGTVAETVTETYYSDGSTTRIIKKS